MKTRKREWKMRDMQRIRPKPQRTVEAQPAKERRRENRRYTR